MKSLKLMCVKSIYKLDSISIPQQQRENVFKKA